MLRRYRQGPYPNIALFSSARSGSTWLGEMLAAESGILLLDEPCHPKNLSPLVFGTAEDWAHLLPSEEREARLAKYFDRILAGNLYIGAPRLRSRNYRTYCNRIVLKMLRFKDLIEWFELRFDLQIIYLVRHPLATNLSRQECPRLPLFLANEAFCSTYLSEPQLRFSRQILANGTKLEKNVLDWCLQNLPAIDSPSLDRWCCVHYEDLVTNAHAEVARIARFAGFESSKPMLSRSQEASLSTSQCDDTTKQFFDNRDTSNSGTEFLLNKWRAKLQPGDEERAFQILDTLGIDCYAVGEDRPVRRLSNQTVNCTTDEVRWPG